MHILKYVLYLIIFHRPGSGLLDAGFLVEESGDDSPVAAHRLLPKAPGLQQPRHRLSGPGTQRLQ